MVTGLGHKKGLKKQQIVKKINKIMQTKINKHTYVYGLPIKSGLKSRGKQCRSNNTEINSPPNHVL